MFKLNKPRSGLDRFGERVEFRFLSFQAFQVPKGWDKVHFSIISVETGKTIAKSNRTTVRSGTCQWTETFSEVVCIPHDDASKELEQCLYKIVVSMGSHRSGILGEVVLNLMDYMSSRNSNLLSLPLKKCNYGTILQVRIDCLNPKPKFRDGISPKESTSHLEALHSSNDEMDSKSDGSDNVFNRSIGSSSSNHLSNNYADEPVNRDASFSASGSQRSSDSGDGSVGRMSFSPRNLLTGGSQVGRQDSAGSHISATLGPGDDLSRSNPSSFNSRASGSSTPHRWQESTVQTSARGLGPISLRPSGSPKDFLEAAEETIEELQDEAKMWERHSQKLKLDLEKLKKECSDKSKHQAELDMKLSAAYSERDSLKQEAELLKSSLEEITTKQNATGTAKIKDLLRAQKELEDEAKFHKESNANLSMQLKKTQEANIELVAILEELEETIEKQRLELANPPEQSPLSEHEGDLRSQQLLDIEAEWEIKLTAKEEQISKLEEKLSCVHNPQSHSEVVSDQGYPDLMEEIEELRTKVQELERDCAELTDENLELIFKLKDSGQDIKGVRGSNNPETEITMLNSQIDRLEEELRSKELLNDDLMEPSEVLITNLEKKCADLELELQHFKNQAYDLDVKLNESQAEVEGKMVQLTKLEKKLESFQFSDTKGSDTVIGRRDASSTEVAGNNSDMEELKAALSLKENDIDVLRHSKEELEDQISNLQKENRQLEENVASVLRESSITSKCLEDVQHDLVLLTSSVDSHVSTNKMLERKSMELESGKHELEIHISELEEENVQLSERISGLEAQLRHLTNEKESNRLDLEDSRSLIVDLKDELAKRQVEIETQKGELKQKLQETQIRLSEAQEETEYLKRSHSKLQSTVESLIEECNSLQKSTGDLRRQKLELHEHSTHLEVELRESEKKKSDFMKKVEFLESKFSSLQNDIALKEKSLISQLESIFDLYEDQEEKIAKAQLMLNQIDVEKATEVENLKREIAHLSSQVCSTQDEQERTTSDTARELSSLRSDKVKLETSLQEAHAKVKMYENELQTLKQESGKKVQGLVDLLNASNQSEEMLMSDIEHMQRQTDAARSCEEKSKRMASELELKLKASDYEKQQTMEEISNLNVQLQKIPQLQDEVLALRSSLDEAKFEKGKLEELLQSVSEDCEELKKERIPLMEKITNMQEALRDGENDRRSRIALEEKLLRLEGDLTAKEASYAHEAELKNEINRIKRANSEYQRKVQCLEEERNELTKKAEVLDKELMLKKEGNREENGIKKGGREMLSSEQHEEEMQRPNVSKSRQDFDHDQTKRMDDNKLHDLEAKIQSLEAKLAEAVETNDMYRSQLKGSIGEKQSSNTEVIKKSVSDNDMKYSHASKASKIASLEAELKDMRDRYLHMSLQYAEVEAEREELVMKMKNMTKGKRWFQ